MNKRPLQGAPHHHGPLINRPQGADNSPRLEGRLASLVSRDLAHPPVVLSRKKDRVPRMRTHRMEIGSLSCPNLSRVRLLLKNVRSGRQSLNVVLRPPRAPSGLV